MRDTNINNTDGMDRVFRISFKQFILVNLSERCPCPAYALSLASNLALTKGIDDHIGIKTGVI